MEIANRGYPLTPVLDEGILVKIMILEDFSSFHCEKILFAAAWELKIYFPVDVPSFITG